MINQDEHKIPVDELVKRLETNLDNVSVKFWKVLCNVLLSKKKDKTRKPCYYREDRAMPL